MLMSFHLQALTGALALLVVAGCGSGNKDAQANNVTADAGGMTAVSGQPGGSAGAGAGEGGTSAGGAGGTSTGGAGAPSGGASGNSGGSAGASPASNMVGVQADPTMLGDGQFDIPISAADPKMPYPAPPETLMRAPNVPAGTVDLKAQNLYESKTVFPGKKFQYWVYVPSQYKPGKPAALMVFQDGVHYLGLTEAKFNTYNVFDNLIASGDMPVTIGLFVNPGVPNGIFDSNAATDVDTRRVEYTTASDAYARFLTEELIPDVISAKYAIVQDPNGWAVSGHSAGGICAFLVGWYQPQKFHKVLSHDASFWRTAGASAMPIVGSGPFPEEIGKVPAKPLRVMLLSGPNDNPSLFGDNNRAAQLLAQQGYHYRYMVGQGVHYPPVQAVADYVNALKWLWRGYSLPWY